VVPVRLWQIFLLALLATLALIHASIHHDPWSSLPYGGSPYTERPIYDITAP